MVKLCSLLSKSSLKQKEIDNNSGERIFKGWLVVCNCIIPSLKLVIFKGLNQLQ